MKEKDVQRWDREKRCRRRIIGKAVRAAFPSTASWLRAICIFHELPQILFPKTCGPRIQSTSGVTHQSLNIPFEASELLYLLFPLPVRPFLSQLPAPKPSSMPLLLQGTLNVPREVFPVATESRIPRATTRPDFSSATCPKPL